MLATLPILQVYFQISFLTFYYNYKFKLLASIFQHYDNAFCYQNLANFKRFCIKFDILE